MGMGCFTGGFQNWDPYFSIVAFVACLIGRAINIFPLTFLANLCREKSNKIPAKMSVVLWFAGLRGAIAFALSENMVCAMLNKHDDVKYKYNSFFATFSIKLTI